MPSLNVNVDNERTIEQIRAWLGSCECLQNDSHFKPSRLVDVGDSHGCESIRVINTLGLAISDYVCLSYCWGGKQPIICTSQKLGNSGTWIIDLQDLPRTFKDTIKVCRQLNFRFIWIDSLCIIQDDPVDVESEILQMPSIYRNAQMTLCASSAKSIYEGFLESRPDYSLYKVRVALPGHLQGSIYFDRIFWSEPPTIEPLGTRAWALQERLLSSRLLEYGWRIARWSCACISEYSGYQPLTTVSKQTGNHAQLYNLFKYLNPQGVRNLACSKDELFLVGAV